MRYAGDEYLWHRHVTGVDLYPHQQVYCKHLREFHTNLMIASRRIGKSFSVASFLLKEAVTKPRSEINIHAPALEQSKRNLRYMIDMCLNSDILMAFIEKKLGEGIGKESIEFCNGSVIQAKGQASSVDGLGATHQWWEEVDDMMLDTLYERIYPTGSMIKPSYDYGQWGQCCRIATGTIKGKGNTYTFEHPPEGAGVTFHVLPKYTGWHGVEWGIIPRNDLILARDVLMTPEQFARTYLVLYTESANFFPTRKVDQCQHPNLKCIDIVEYKKETGSPHYIAEGNVTVGIDCGGQGTGDHPSEWAIDFCEDLGWGHMKWIYGERFSATADPEEVRQQMGALCEFFRPGRGYGDAFDTTFLYGLNKYLREHGVTKRDPADWENRQGAGGWAEWHIVPIRFIGITKHQLFKNLRMQFFQQRLKIPYYVDDLPEYKELKKLRDQLENIKKADMAATQGYDKYEMVRAAVGDDHVDATALAVYAQGELTQNVRPLGMAVEGGGFRDFSQPNIVSDQVFVQRPSGIFTPIGDSAPPTNVGDFLKDRD